MHRSVKLLERSRGVKVGPQTAAQRAAATSEIEALLKYASSELSPGRDRAENDVAGTHRPSWPSPHVGGSGATVAAASPARKLQTVLGWKISLSASSMTKSEAWCA